MQLHSLPRCNARLQTSILLAILLSATTVLAAAAADEVQCSSFEECCGACGADSYRCARGPCSTSFITKKAFSISVPTQDVGFWDVVLVFYGMVPYLVPLALALVIIFVKRTWTLILSFLLIPIVAVINQGIIVPSLGDCSECARPCGACVVSNGMPSGHAASSIAFCLWFLLETLLGIGKHWSLRKKILVILADLLLFVPDPYSRVYIGDHTPLQVTVVSAIGIVFAVIYFVVVRYVLGKKLDRASQWLAQGRCPVHVVNDFYSKTPRSSHDAVTAASNHYTEASSPV